MLYVEAVEGVWRVRRDKLVWMGFKSWIKFIIERRGTFSAWMGFLKDEEWIVWILGKGWTM